MLKEQVRQLQVDKTTLEAKLKEAFSARPAAADPRELAKAQDQAKTLQKENDLLKVTLALTRNYEDLLQALGGSNGIYTIEDLFRQMSAEIPEFEGLTLSKIGDLGLRVLKEDESPRPPRDPKAKDIEKAEKKRPPGR